MFSVESWINAISLFYHFYLNALICIHFLIDIIIHRFGRKKGRRYSIASNRLEEGWILANSVTTGHNNLESFGSSC